MKLYYNPISPNCRKVLATVAHLKIKLDEELVDLSKGGHKSPELLKLNPNGKLPVLADGSFVLWESNAIMAYLASRQETPAWPKTDLRYDVMRWMFWEASHWQPAVGTLISERVLKPLRGAQPNPEAIKQAESEVARYGAVLNSHLEAHSWLVGKEVTLADLCVGAALTHKDAAKIPLDGFRHLQSWYGQLQKLDAWRKISP